jgi:hypothetical protein
LTDEESQRRITTVQRSIGNPHVRAALGLIGVQNGGLRRIVPRTVFEPRADRFIAELDATLTSRSGKKERNTFVAKLLDELGEPAPRIEPKRLDDDTPDDVPGLDSAIEAEGSTRDGDQSVLDGGGGTRIADRGDQSDGSDRDDGDLGSTGEGSRDRASRPRDKSRLTVFGDLDDALNDLGNHKLLSLHASITDISAERHTPLVAIGLWAFIEVLTRAAGRDEKSEIVSFYSNFIRGKGVGKSEQKSQRQSLSSVMEKGDATKHHAIAMNVDRKQLQNDFEVLRPVLVLLAKMANELKSS